MAKKSKNSFTKNLLIPTLIGLVCFIFLYSKFKTATPASNQQVLVSYVPNFDNLTLDDLPDFSDIRDVYDYNGNTLVVGYNRIVEYNTASNMYVRVNDPKVLGCINSSAKIDNFLYISCNSHYPENKQLPNDKSVVASSVYKIDLETGKIIKKYFGNELESDPDLIANNEFVFKTKGLRSNLHLGSRGNTLYMASWDGVEKMDILSGKISLYSGPNEIKPGNELTGIGLNSDVDWFRMNPPFKQTVFKSITPLHDGKYYILASDGLYSLSDGQFPHQIISAVVSGDVINSGITKDGRYSVFVGPAYNMGAVIGVHAYLADINKNTVKNISIISKNVNTKAEKISSKIEKGYFEESDGKILLMDSVTNLILLSVNINSARLEISN